MCYKPQQVKSIIQTSDVQIPDTEILSEVLHVT